MAMRKKETQTVTETPKVETASPKVKANAAGIEVDLTPPSEEDDDDDGGEELSRQGKKLQRKSLREQAAEDREARLNAERIAHEAIGYAQGLRQYAPPPGQQHTDPFAAAEADLDREEDLMIKEYQLSAKNWTEEQHSEFRRRSRAHQNKRTELGYKRLRAAEQPQQQANPVMLTLQSRYPDVMSNDSAVKWAASRYENLRHDPQEQAPDNWDTLDRVMRETRERFGMGDGAEMPQQRENPRRYEGVSAGPAAGKGQKQRVTVQLTRDQVAEADSAYLHLEPEARYKRYAQVIQKKTA